MLHNIELSSGTVEYVDTGGSGPVIVLLHGLAMDYTLWDEVIGLLQSEFRCIAPTLPVGAHRHPVKPCFHLSPDSVSSLVGEFIEALDLRNVVLVENDSGRAQTLAGTEPDRLAKLVIVACEAFENYPPGLPGKVAGRVAQLPGGVRTISWLIRNRAIRNSRFFFGLMSKRRIPDRLSDSWMASLIGNKRIRRDFERYCRSVQRDDMLRAAAGLRKFEKPVLVVWAAEDKVMPYDHGSRLVETLPNATLVVINDCRTLVPVDQPTRLAAELRCFAEPT